MKRFALLLATTAFVTPAIAADVVYEEPPAPMAVVEDTGWSGFYVGAQAGGAFMNSDDGTLGFDASFGNNTPVTAANGGILNAPARNGFAAGSLGAAFGETPTFDFEEGDDSSFVGGGHVGYDYQMGSFVIGGILDVNSIDVSRKAFAFSNTPAVYIEERSLDLLATARVRAGYTVTDTALAYVSGGLAYGEIDYSFATDSPAVSGNSRSGAAARPAIVNEDEDGFGYTVGGGVEFKIVDNISLGAEYLYTNLGEGDSSTTLDGGPFDGTTTNGAGTTGESTEFSSNEDFDFHTVTAKISYRFN